MKKELLDELVTAAQEVVNDAETACSTDPMDLVPGECIERLRKVVKAISDDAVREILTIQAEGKVCGKVKANVLPMGGGVIRAAFCDQPIRILSGPSLGCVVHGVHGGRPKALFEVEQALGHYLSAEEREALKGAL